MNIYYYVSRSGVRNFGDELNSWLWPRLIPQIDSDKLPSGSLVGIGTLLNDLIPTNERTYILGAGAGYGNPINRPGKSWTVYFVRGPRTAQQLGLRRDRAVTDGAILVADVYAHRTAARTEIGLIPHWLSTLDAWKSVAQDLDLLFIDPTEDVEIVMAKLASCKLVLAEAMHGAIIADFFRIPWIPLKSRNDILDFKWIDWCESMELDYRPVTLPSLWPNTKGANFMAPVKDWAKRQYIKKALSTIKKNTGNTFLSSDAVFRSRKALAIERLDEFKNDIGL